MTKRTRYFMTGSAAVLATGLCTGLVAYYGDGFPALVASTGPTELSYVRADAAVVAYADVRSIMDSELRRRFKESVPLPMHEEGHREFLEQTGIDIERDIDYVVAAAAAPAVGGDIKPHGVVVARGRFDEVKLEEFARQHGAEVQEYKGKRLLVLQHSPNRQAAAGVETTISNPNETGVLAFLEPGLVAIGDFDSVHRAIDAQLSGQSITANNEMMSLVADIERTNNAWAVGRFDLISRQANLPEQIARQIPPVKWFAAAGHINGGVSVQLRAEATDDQAAENLRGVVNGVISLARLQGQNDPKLTALIQSLQLSGHGKTVAALVHRACRDLRADGAQAAPTAGRPVASGVSRSTTTAGGVSAGPFHFRALAPVPADRVSSRTSVPDIFFYGTLMAGFDRRQNAGIDDQLTYLGRGAIRAALFDFGPVPGSRSRPGWPGLG